MFKKIVSFILLISLVLGISPISIIGNTYAADGDQVLTAPSPTFVENQVQPISSFKMNRFLLGYNVDKHSKTYLKQLINLDRDTLGGVSFRLSRTNELKAGQEAEKLHLYIIQKDSAGIEQVLAETVKPGVSSMSKTEVKWLFPAGLTITPKKDFALKIEVENPNTTEGENNFPYYIYGKEAYDKKPLYFGNMLYFDGETENPTSDILSLTILRADNNNLGVPIPSPYKYPELESIHSYISNASNFRVVTEFNGIDNSNVNDKCNDGVTDGMEYRPLTDAEFEKLLRHSKYFNVLMDKVSATAGGGIPIPISNYIYVTPTSYYSFNGMSSDEIKSKRIYKSKSSTAGTGNTFAFCVYKENANHSGDTKEVNAKEDEKIVLSNLEYDTRLNLTNKTANQTILTLRANQAIFNDITKTIKGIPYDTGIDIQAGNLIKVLGRIAINNSGFHDSNGYRDPITKLKQGQIAYKIGNSEWKTGGNIIEINNSGRLYLAVVDNDNNLDNNLGSYKVIIEKVIVTNSIRKDNNLYFNINKNINKYSVNLGKTTDGTDFTQIYQSPYTEAPKIKVKGLSFTYEDRYSELEGTTGLAFDGSYYYTIKGNKLLQIGSGYNSTENGEITEYELDKDLGNILSIVAIDGDLYVGYNDKGLSNYIGRIKYTTAGHAVIENIPLQDSLLSVDLGDIKNRKLEKNRYLLTADNRYIYNISYLAGNETEGNNPNKDKGYQIKIFDPKNEMALIKNIFVSPILDKDGNLKEKIGYYTEGAFVDRNYLYIIEKNTHTDTSNVIILDKVKFDVIGKTSITQYNNSSDCDTASDSTAVYSCATTGVYDLINDRLITLSGNVGKLHFYNIDTDNLVHFRIPLSVDLDDIEQKQKFLISYNYKYDKILTPESYITADNSETMSNDTKYTKKGYKIYNDKITVNIADVVRETANDKLYKEYIGLTRLTRNDGNSSSIRKNDRGINYSYLKINDVVHKWRGDYATVSRIKDKGWEIWGERDAQLIVPGIRFELDEGNEFIKITLSLRNDSSVTLENNSVVYAINLGGDYNFIDNRGVTDGSIGDYADKYIVADDTGTDDSLFFGIKDSTSQRIGLGNGVLQDVKLIVGGVTLNPGETRSFDFYVGSKLDSEDNNHYYNKILNSKDLITDYSFQDHDNINNKLLNTSISKNERIISAPEIGVDEDYLYESDNVNIVVPFNETWDDDRVDSNGLPLSGNGWWSDNWIRDSTQKKLKTTIENAAGNGKISSLELVKYIPEDTTLTFTINGKTDSSNDLFAFFLDDDQKLSVANTINHTYTYNVPKGLHIFTWKYGKDQHTGNENDIIYIDDINIGKTLEVFGDNCPYSGSALFYTTAYYNNFNKIETSNGDSHVYRDTECDDEGVTLHSKTRRGPVDCNEEDAGQGTHNGITSRTELNDTDGGRWDTSRTRAYGWYVAKYGNGQVATANQFVDNGYEADKIFFDITHPNGSGGMKIYYDVLYGPGYKGDDRGSMYYDNRLLGEGGDSSYYMTNKWRTKIMSDDYNENDSKTLYFKYGETDGGDDGATYFDNVVLKIEDPKSGCHMTPLPYNDKLGTHFILHGYNMQTSTDRTKDVKGVASIIPIEEDTFVEIQKLKLDGTPIGDKKLLYNSKIGQQIKFNVEEGYNYDIVSNKNISVLMDNFYPDLTRTGDTTNDDTPTYDIQNGNKFVILLPGNKYKKGNLYIAHYELDKNTHVKVTDLTNNKTNFEFDLIGENSANQPIPLKTIQLDMAGTNSASTGEKYSIFTTKDGKVYTVGENDKGQLGDETNTDNTNIVEMNSDIFNGAKIVSVVSGDKHNVLLDEFGRVYSTGSNSNGQLGNGSSADVNKPVKVEDLNFDDSRIISIAAGANSSYFIDEKGIVYSVGQNDKGQLGDGTTSDSSIPAKVNTTAWGSKKIIFVSGGNKHAMFIAEDGKAYAVGDNTNGELGDGTNTLQNKPVAIDNTLWGDTKVKMVSAGNGHSLILTEDGKVYATGLNDKGQLGNGTLTNSNTPVEVDSSAWTGKSIVYVNAGNKTSFFVDEDGKVYATGLNDKGQLGDNTTTDHKTPVAIDSSAWGSSKILNINSSLNGYTTIFVDENNKAYGTGENTKGELANGNTTNAKKPAEVDSSAWNPDVIRKPNILSGIFPKLSEADFELNKPYRSYPGIGEGQILKIESDNPITVYYGLGETPAIAELISPNSQDFYYPILAKDTNYTDYNTQMYSYYDLNLAKIKDYKNRTLRSGTINVGDDISVGLNKVELIKKWNKGVSTGPVGLAVGNKSSSYDYLYPIKSSKKLFGIGNQYLFNNVNADKLIIIADYNDGNDVNVVAKKGDTVVKNFTLHPKQQYVLNIDDNSFYTIETDDVDKHVYVYAEKGDNVRNTFATIFKSRKNEQLGDKVIKLDIGDKYLKYDIMGDFDFLTDEPIETGEININGSMYDVNDSNNPKGVLTRFKLQPDEKVVVNGAYSYEDPTPKDLIIDNLAKGRYVNGIHYKTLKNESYDRGLFYKTNTYPDLRYLGGGLINKLNEEVTYDVAPKDDDFSDNGPNAIYKKYSADTYFPEISWTPLYDFIKATGNKLEIDLNGTDYFGKRNLSKKPFDLTFKNGEMKVSTTANSHEFTDTYYIPVMRRIDENTLDYVELNKITTLNFTIEGDSLGTICATVEDNNKVRKNICYNNELNEAELRTDLLSVGRVKHIDSSLTSHKRNLYSDYVKIFNDGTKPMKLLGLEFAGVKKRDFTTKFKDVAVENYTDINPQLFFKPNKNIFSENIPLSHSLRIGILDIERGSKMLEPTTDTLNVNVDGANERIDNDSFSFTYKNITYNMAHIKDNDLLNDDNNESDFKPSRLFPLEEKNDYVLFFRARGFGLKEIKLVNEDNTNTYIDSLFTPRQYTGNMLNGKDIGDLYSLKFKTNWDENENVKVQLINHNGDLWVSDVFLLRLDDSDFAKSEKVPQDDGTLVEELLPNTGKIPTMLAENKKGNVKGETIFKNVSYYKYNDNTWIGDIADKDELKTVFENIDDEPDIQKIYTYLDDKNILNFMDGQKFEGIALEKMTTNLFSEKEEKIKLRVGLVGTIKLNGTTIYSNLKSEHFGCIAGTGDYTDYNEDNIKENNCLISLQLEEGNNVFEVYSVIKNPNKVIKGFYKDKSLTLVSERTGSTTRELLTYSTTPGMPVSVYSFNPYNTKLDNAIQQVGNEAIIGLTTKTLNVLSIQNIDRDYSLKEIPYILNTRTNRNHDIKNIERLLEFGMDKKLSVTEGTHVDDYVKSANFITNGKVDIKTTAGSNTIGLNKNDILEIFVKFPNKPNQFNIELDNGSKTQNLFWGDNYIFTDEVDGINIIRVGDINSLEEDEWYKFYIPVKGTILENNNLVNLNFSTFGGDMQISEITILKDKLISEGNNIKVTFDVDILEDTQKRDIIFGLTNNATLLEKQGYQITFSKNSSTTEIKKNGVVIGSVTNDDSFIKDGVEKYKIMFVKNKNHLYVAVKYDFVDPTDGIFKTKVDQLLDVIDNEPLNLKNSQLVFKNNRNKYKVSNILIEDGEDNEKLSFIKFSSINDLYSDGTITVYNDRGDVDSVDFNLYDNVEDIYTSIAGLSSYNSIITDIEITPNKSPIVSNRFRIKEVALIKGTETPAIISGNSTMDLLGVTRIKKGSSVYQLFNNSKEYIMGFTVFVSKPHNTTQPEGLTLKLYEADSNGNPKVDGSGNKIVLAEKTVNTDAVKVAPDITPLKIVFPQVAVVDGQDYVFELSTNNEEGLYVYGTNVNKFTEGYAYSINKEKSYIEAFEFNEFGDRVYGERGSTGYLGSTLGGTDVPDREIVSGENLKVVAHKSNRGTITIDQNDNINLKNQATFLFKGKFTQSDGNGWIVIAEKEVPGKRVFGFYIDKNEPTKLHYAFNSLDGNKIAWGVSSFPVVGVDTTIALTIDTVDLRLKLYKDGNLEDVVSLDPALKGVPFIKADTAIKFFGHHDYWTGDQELDYFRIYDKVLTEEEIRKESQDITNYRYRLPYDLAFFMISKSNEIETIEERTYDLGEGKIYEVKGDLILEGYDAGDGVKRLILKGNSTFRVKGNIYVTADEVLVINDNTLEGDKALSYIGFVTDNDIIIGKNVKYMQGGYFAKRAIKTELSNIPLRVNGLLSSNEIDLQNRTYLQQGKVCSSNEEENCSVVLEFDKRIYKRMPPLFYENNNKNNIEIKEE